MLYRMENGDSAWRYALWIDQIGSSPVCLDQGVSV